jgi:hypothetical protein
MLYHKARRLLHRAARKTNVCSTVAKWIGVALLACAALVHPRLRRQIDFLPVRLLAVSPEAHLHTSWHGTVIVYETHASIRHQVADMLEPAWYQLGTLMEFAFRVNRPELLRHPKDSALRQLACQFEARGYRVKELHVRVDAVTIVHFLA